MTKNKKLMLGDELIMDNILDMPLERLKMLNKRISGLIHKKATCRKLKISEHLKMPEAFSLDKNKQNE